MQEHAVMASDGMIEVVDQSAPIRVVPDSLLLCAEIPQSKRTRSK
jgi:hypothetical protein